MRGQRQLVQLRQRGYVPDCVWIDTDGPNQINPADDWHAMDSRQAHLQTEHGDKFSRLDMRCVSGLRCYIDGTTAEKVHAMRDACIRVGAARVIASVLMQLGQGEFITFRVVETTDTDGVFIWPDQAGAEDG